MATKALAAFWFITSSTASMPPPTQRSAASKLPGDIEVSASICTRPSVGEASRIASTYSIGCASAMVSSGARGASIARQRLEALVLERLLDGAQPVGPLGMAGRIDVIEAGGMGDEQRGH